MTSRKSHKWRFRLVPKSTTSDDLERPLRILFQNTRVFGAHHENFQIGPHYQQRRCSPMTLVSGKIRFMRIFAGVPWRRGIKRQWGCRKRQFSVLSLTISSEALELRPTSLYIVPRRLSADSKLQCAAKKSIP